MRRLACVCAFALAHGVCHGVCHGVVSVHGLCVLFMQIAFWAVLKQALLTRQSVSFSVCGPHGQQTAVGACCLGLGLLLFCGSGCAELCCVMLGALVRLGSFWVVFLACNTGLQQGT